ncbi:MAG: GtrA family protein [Nitrospira sp.]|nr:GtrA family protein [Nitrospira sp.]
MNLRSQFSRFLFVGGFATALQYVILISLVQGWGVDAVAASTAGFLVSAIFNYVLNRRFTFISEVAHARAFPRFIAVAVGGLAINAAVVWLLVDTAGLHYLLAQVIATLIALVWNFVCNRIWTFSARG